MKILVITHTFLPIIGGAELGLYELYNRLSNSHTIKLLTPIITPKLRKTFNVEETTEYIPNFEVHYFKDTINFMRLKGHHTSKGLMPPFSFSIYPVLKRIVDSFHPDLIHLNYAFPYGLAVWWLKEQKGIPVILSIIGREIPGPNIPYFWKYYVKFIVNKVNFTIYLTKYSHTALLGESRSTHGVIIPYGVDFKRFRQTLSKDEIRSQFNIPKDEIILFSLQRLSKEKRVDLLIRSMEYISKGEKKVKLIIGGKGPEESFLKQLVKQMNLSSKIMFAGHIRKDDLPKYFVMSDIFVLHSTYETFGAVLVEAMATGKPIVSVKSTAIPDVIDDGINGLLVEPNNPKAFAESVIKLIRNKELRKEFSLNAHKKAMKEYNWDKIAEEYESLFKQCIDKNKY